MPCTLQPSNSPPGPWVVVTAWSYIGLVCGLTLRTGGEMPQERDDTILLEISELRTVIIQAGKDGQTDAKFLKLTSQ
jgi:hypothetical protein